MKFVFSYLNYMKKILYIEGCRDGTIGGSHTCLYSMVTNINRNKFQPIVVFYDDHHIAHKLRDLNIKVHIFPNKKPIIFTRKLKKSSFKKITSRLFLLLQKMINFSSYFLRPALYNALFIKKNNIDIVHLNNSVNGNHEWILAAKIACTKIITHQRGITNKLSHTVKFLGKNLDAIICISKTVFKDISRQNLKAEKLKIVYDGIDFSSFKISMDAKSIREFYSIDTTDPVVGVVGNIKQWKGQEVVVRAVNILKKTLPGIKCLLVGEMFEGDPYYLKIKKSIDEFSIANNVIFTGFQKNPADFINVMDVVVHSSIEPEPFGMVNLEAMYMRKPVVSTNIGGPTEVFTSGKDGILITPGNPEHLAQTLSLLLNNRGLRQKIGEEAHKTIMRKFTINRTVEEIEKCYEALSQ